MKSRNVTLTLPEHLLRRIKLIAAKREVSVSAMLARALQQIAEEEDGYGKAHRAMMDDLRKGFDLGTRGKIEWTRDSLHER